LTAQALSVRGKVQQNDGNSNGDPGVALTVLGVPDDAWANVVELGTSEPGRIARYSAICEPDVRVVTHIGPAHLEELRDLDGVAREKGELFATARPGDVAVVNLADPKVAHLPIPEGVRRIGVGSGGDVSLASFELDPESLSGRATWQTPMGLVTATLRSPAAFVAEDAALALAVAYALNVDLHEAAAALEFWAPQPGRLCPMRLDCGATVLDDTFNANPQSVAAALDLLAGLPGRRVAVLGDMAELGEPSHAHHQQIASHAAGLGLDRVLLIGSRFAGAVGRDPISVEGAAAALEGWLRPGDHVLVKGSRMMGLEAVVRALRPLPELA
jgi:UDP-N-acetylmuramoyl-tripeptide--D-alanyl-D-alanine ligase